MSSIKRKIPAELLQRRVRPRREDSEELEPERSDASASEEEGDQSESQWKRTFRAASKSHEDLFKAKALLNAQRERGETALGQLLELSLRLQQAEAKLKGRPTELAGPEEPKGKKGGDDTWNDNEAKERREGYEDRRKFKRSSKHAPQELSSKIPVSWKREVIQVVKPVFRDPRFEGTMDKEEERRAKARYAFLDDYRIDEMMQLREDIKKTKDERAKEKMQRELMVMESRMKTSVREQKAQAVLDRHRKEEKERTRQGKQPFYLKKSEQRKEALVEQFAGLQGKQLDHVIERRRRKVEGKEKKNLPFERRERE